MSTSCSFLDFGWTLKVFLLALSVRLLNRRWVRFLLFSIFSSFYRYLSSSSWLLASASYSACCAFVIFLAIFLSSFSSFLCSFFTIFTSGLLGVIASHNLESFFLVFYLFFKFHIFFEIIVWITIIFLW